MKIFRSRTLEIRASGHLHRLGLLGDFIRTERRCSSWALLSGVSAGWGFELS